METIMTQRIVRLLAIGWWGLLATSMLCAAPAADVPFAQEVRGEVPALAGSAAHVRAIDVDASGRVWVATEGGVRFLAGDAWQEPAGAKIDGPTFDLEIDAKGDVWIGAWNGLYVARAGDSPALEAVSGPEGPISAVRAGSARVLVGGPQGIWAQQGEAWEKIDARCATSIRDLIEINGDVWIATKLGLYRYRRGQTDRYFQPVNLCSCELQGLVVGKDGRLWVASGDGIDVFADGKHVARYQEEEARPPARDARKLEFGPDGRLWVASALGVMRWDGKQWSLRHSMRWVPSDDVRDVAFGPNGDVWLATTNGVGRLQQKEMTLADKAAHYQQIVEARHVRAPGLVEKCRLKETGDLASWYPTDTDNDGMYTGMYVTSQAYRYAATGDPQARENAIRAFDALVFLQQVSGTDGFIARTVIPADWTEMADENRTVTPQEEARERVQDPRDKPVEVRWRKSADGKWLWKGDTSSDEITGHFSAFAVYFDLIAQHDEQERAKVQQHVRRVMDYIMAGGYELMDIDGRPTRWGNWSPRKLNDDPNWRLDRGVNSVELLSYLATAHHITGDEKYRRAAATLFDEHDYGRNVLDPQVDDPGSFTHIDTQLLALTYPALMKYDTDARRQAAYRTGIERWFAICRGDRSPFYDVVYGQIGGIVEKVDAEGIAAYLRDVPLDMVQWTIDNSRRNDVRLVRRPAADRWQVDRLLPPSERAILKWDSSPYAAIAGEGGRTENATVSWLVPYWMGRALGYIAAPEGN
jgi:hypothetical protein